MLNEMRTSTQKIGLLSNGRSIDCPKELKDESKKLAEECSNNFYPVLGID